MPPRSRFRGNDLAHFEEFAELRRAQAVPLEICECLDCGESGLLEKFIGLEG
jgi:hypothetical protein